ncbi:hypothetical protein [Sessilibacter corallicola]|uniref:Uncharacterized protein n=1 Tax=Sessilibacter corallicola TaxID=2904075 RepID=A0ABQ0ABJ0_9GAMM
MSVYTSKYVTALEDGILYLCFDAFDEISIKTIIQFLIDEPEKRLQKDGDYSSVFPVSIRIGENLIFDEHAFWDLCVQSSIFDVADIEAYFETAKNYFLYSEDQMHRDDDFGVVGICSVFSFLKYSLPEYEIGKYRDRESIKRVIQVFVEALRYEDLDHEMLHNDYIVRVLSFLRSWDESEKQLFIKLLLIRLTRGQINLTTGFMSDAFEHYLTRGGLRYFVHYLLEHLQGNIEDVISLCGYVYVFDDQPTKDVLEYCHIRWPEVIPRSAVSNYKSNRRTISLDQKFLELWNTKSSFNTGFHTGADYQWKKIEYTEERIKSSSVKKIENFL